MGFVPFDDTIKLELVFQADGQFMENVLYYITDETPNEDLLYEAAEQAQLEWWNHIADYVSGGVSLAKIKATIMEQVDSPGIEYTTDMPMFGKSTGNVLPFNVTVAVKLLTRRRGRSYRGRIYHVGLAENMVSVNSLEGTLPTDLANAYGNLVTLSTSVGPLVLGVASRRHNGVERVSGVITPVTEIAVDPVIDSQRRRLPGRGR